LRFAVAPFSLFALSHPCFLSGLVRFAFRPLLAIGVSSPRFFTHTPFASFCPYRTHLRSSARESLGSLTVAILRGLSQRALCICLALIFPLVHGCPAFWLAVFLVCLPASSFCLSPPPSLSITVVLWRQARHGFRAGWVPVGSRTLKKRARACRFSGLAACCAWFWLCLRVLRFLPPPNDFSMLPLLHSVVLRQLCWPWAHPTAFWFIVESFACEGIFSPVGRVSSGGLAERRCLDFMCWHGFGDVQGQSCEGG